MTATIDHPTMTVEQMVARLYAADYTAVSIEFSIGPHDFGYDAVISVHDEDWLTFTGTARTVRDAIAEAFIKAIQAGD